MLNVLVFRNNVILRFHAWNIMVYNTINIDDGQTNTYTVTDLNNGGTYTVSVTGTAENRLPSSAIEAISVALGWPVWMHCTV